MTVSVCHTDHTDSIVSSMVCIFDFKNNFLCNRKHSFLGLDTPVYEDKHTTFLFNLL